VGKKCVMYGGCLSIFVNSRMTSGLELTEKRELQDEVEEISRRDQDLFYRL
jgi:hypothetical protein